MSGRTRALVVGGGVGALEAALALRALAFDHVDVELLTAEPHFVYRPLAVGEPFGVSSSWRFDIADIAADRGFGVRRGVMEEVDTPARAVRTADGEEIGYDALVLAIGARTIESVPGALTFRGSQDAQALAESLDVLRGNGGAKVAFVAGSEHGWVLPLYELALLTSAWVRDHEADIEVSVVTAESEPLIAFGRDASAELVALLAEHGVAVRAGATPGDITATGADLVVALPRLAGPAVRGITNDPDGFAVVDDYCRVEGAEAVYAVGDMTNRPVKQGGLASQQADVAARAIAAAAGAPVDPEPYRPVLRGLLMTGERMRWMRRPGGRGGHRPDAALAVEALWWPKHKIAAPHLAPYLAANSHLAIPSV